MLQIKKKRRNENNEHTKPKGPFIIYDGGGGGAGKNKGGNHANFRTVRGGVMRKLVYKRGGLSDFTIKFCFVLKKCVHCCRQY